MRSQINCFTFRFSFDSFLNAPKSENSDLSSLESSHKTVSRSHSDSSSTSSSKSDRPFKSNRSVDSAPSMSQQLLKLSLYNSRNTNSSFDNATVAEFLSSEAKKIAKMFSDSGDLSFEDLNNISQNLVDNSFIDDLQEMNLKAINNCPQAHSSPCNSERQAIIQETLKRIKEEDPDCFESSDTVKLEASVIVKDEPYDTDDPQPNGELELDGLLQNLKSLINEGNKEEAKKQLSRLNDLLGKPKSQHDQRNTLAVHPIIRQATFEIDPETGKHNYHNNSTQPMEAPTSAKTDNEDLLEKLTKLLGGSTVGGNTLDLSALESSGAKVYVVVPSPSHTPSKSPAQRSTSLNTAQKPQSAMKLSDARKLGTPLKRLSHYARPSALTAPRQTVPARSSNLVEQSRVGSVRKSLMGSIEKSPQVPKPRLPSTTGVVPKTTPRPSAAPRRSVSMKASIPAIQTTKPSPLKTAIRPASGAPYTATASANSKISLATPVRPSTAAKAPLSRRISSAQKQPVSQFKAPSVVRKAAAATKQSSDNGSLV